MSLRFAKLTRAAVRALPIGGKISEHTITAKKLVNGDVGYSVGAMIDGQRFHRVVGKESAGVTREQAEILVQTLKTRMREGRFDLPVGRKNHRSLADAASEYLSRLESTGGKKSEAQAPASTPAPYSCAWLRAAK